MKDIYRGLDVDGRIEVFARYLMQYLEKRWPQYDWSPVREMLHNGTHMYVDGWESCYKSLLKYLAEENLRLPEDKDKVWCQGGVSRDLSKKSYDTLRALFESFRTERPPEEVDAVACRLLQFAYLVGWRWEWSDEGAWADQDEENCPNRGWDDYTEYCHNCDGGSREHNCPVNQIRCRNAVNRFIQASERWLRECGIELPPIDDIWKNESNREYLAETEYEYEHVAEENKEYRGGLWFQYEMRMYYRPEPCLSVSVLKPSNMVVWRAPTDDIERDGNGCYHRFQLSDEQLKTLLEKLGGYPELFNLKGCAAPEVVREPRRDYIYYFNVGDKQSEQLEATNLEDLLDVRKKYPDLDGILSVLESVAHFLIEAGVDKKCFYPVVK